MRRSGTFFSHYLPVFMTGAVGTMCLALPAIMVGAVLETVIPFPEFAVNVRWVLFMVIFQRLPKLMRYWPEQPREVMAAAGFLGWVEASAYGTVGGIVVLAVFFALMGGVHTAGLPDTLLRRLYRRGG